MECIFKDTKFLTISNPHDIRTPQKIMVWNNDKIKILKKN